MEKRLWLMSIKLPHISKSKTSAETFWWYNKEPFIKTIPLEQLCVSRVSPRIWWRGRWRCSQTRTRSRRRGPPPLHFLPCWPERRARPPRWSEPAGPCRWARRSPPRCPAGFQCLLAASVVPGHTRGFRQGRACVCECVCAYVMSSSFAWPETFTAGNNKHLANRGSSGKHHVTFWYISLFVYDVWALLTRPWLNDTTCSRESIKSVMTDSMIDG